jgi:hypothetical protein
VWKAKGAIFNGRRIMARPMWKEKFQRRLTRIAGLTA